MKTTTALVAGVVTTLAGTLSAQDTQVLRESVGTRATELAEMELRPFDAKLWSHLEGWTNGSALDASATGGKVVLIGTWSTWNPRAQSAIPALQRLKEAHGEDLIVVGVHHQQGWDSAAEALQKRGADFLIAHDKEGKFREGLMVDQDPDFYLIDRAGQLRFADVRTESLTPAVELLLAEEATNAAGLLSRLEAERAEREAALRRPTTIESAIDTRSLPEVPFTAPEAAAYNLVDWPERKRDDNNRRDEDAGPIQIGLPGAGWADGAAPNAAGRAVAYYEWKLNDPRSADIVQRMDLMQRQLGRDVVVVGVLTGIRGKDNNNRRDEYVDEADLQFRFASFRVANGVRHPMIADVGGNMFNTDGSRSSGNNESSYRALVVSSDGMLRWDGDVRDGGFRAALDRVIDVDPGVRARRKAEQAYIKARGG